MSVFSPSPDSGSAAVDVVVHEQALVARIREGDERAFEAVFNAYAPSLYSHAHRFTRSRIAAEELVHDTFAALWIARERWAVKSSVAAYLHAAVRNRALNYLRRRRSEDAFQAHRPAGEIDTAETAADRALELTGLADAVHRAIAQLPPRRREVFLLHRQHHLTYEEIGELLGLSERTVEHHISNALKVLRGLLAAYLSVTILIGSIHIA
jgi:RNA polymerase sigma-70 factor, ECF subfamily